MPRKYIPWLVLLVVIVLALGVWVGSLMYRLHENGDNLSAYSVVSLQTGAVYYGKLSWWPRPHLDDPWYLSQGSDGTPTIVPFTSTFSGPENKVYLNAKDIVWWARLRADSQVAKGLESASSQIAVPAGQTAQ